MRKFLLSGAFALLTLVMTGCHLVDLDYNNVEAPEISTAPNTLSGVVTSMQGQGVANATVTLGELTATTDASGIYMITDIPAGTYTVTAAAEGYITSEANLTVSDEDKTQNLTWSVALSKEIKETVNVTVNEGGEGSVESEAIAGNDKGEINISVNVPANTVPENTTVTISPVYTEESAFITRADNDKMLIGANVTCSNPNLQLTQPITVSFNVDDTVKTSVETRQLINGQWVTVDHYSDGDGVHVYTKQFGLIGLFFPVTVTTETGREAITFEPAAWDNLYGNRTIVAGSAAYSYKVGAEYNVRGSNSLEALLIERLASIVGPTYKVVTADYPLNVNVPIGTAVSVSGFQAKETVTVTSGNRSAQGTQYGIVTVTTNSYNREHVGGGSVPR